MTRRKLSMEMQLELLEASKSALIERLRSHPSCAAVARVRLSWMN
ncbi:hypothetical protein [Microbulbifer taiwanensis]